MSKFWEGQKVRIVEGGWGIHPQFTGKIVTIRSINSWGRYSIEEVLVSGDVRHYGPGLSCHSNSFAAIPVEVEVPTEQKIREINAEIKQSKGAIESLEAQIAAEIANKARLNGKRQVLVATLLRELDV